MWLSAPIYNLLARTLSIYISVSLSPSDFLSTVIISPPLQLPCQKVNHGTDVFTHKRIELPGSSYICSQAQMYEINYIDWQQDKSSWNFVVGSSHAPLGLQIYILSFPKMLIALTTCMGSGERMSIEKEGVRVKWATHYY